MHPAPHPDRIERIERIAGIRQFEKEHPASQGQALKPLPDNLRLPGGESEK